MTGIALSILGTISAYMAAPIIRGLGYLVHLNGNVETLKNEVEKLEIVKVGIQRHVEAATRNVEEIEPIVQNWLLRVDTIGDEGRSIIQNKAKFPKGCCNQWCLNLKSRYVLSRNAKKKTQDSVKLQQEGKFEKVACPAPLAPVMVSTTTNTFKSRELILNEIIRNLKDDEINMIGICGLGGVGKTTMVEEVFKRAKEENLFDEYAKTVVSQKANSTKIQSDIAEMLGLQLWENNKFVRAGKMNTRLEGKKVLIILDDVWEELDLQALGITFQGSQKRCKIIFTSRKLGLWMDLRNKIDLPLDVLPYEEAWHLFKEKVGDFLDEKPEFSGIAKQIVKECAGLPLALVTIGRSLLGKSEHVWNDTLLKQRMASGEEEKVYQSLKLSYNHLDDGEAKSLFLLCCLFEEDSRISVECLVRIAMGLRLLRGINNVEEARDRVFSLVEQLHTCHLFSSLESPYGEKFIRVHDLVHDFAKSIASRDKGAVVLDHGVKLIEWQEQDILEHPTWVSVTSNEIKELPTSLSCPGVKLLRCKNVVLQIPDCFFEGMGELQVLVLGCLQIPQLASSLRLLKTLCLHSCNLKNVSTIGDLPNLEILSFAGSHIKELPREIGRLANLILLDLSFCWDLKKISPGVIRGLINLQELYMRRVNIVWEGEDNEQGRNASIREFESLTKLHILYIDIKDASLFSRSPIFSNLKKYNIVMGHIPVSGDYEKALSISLFTFVPLQCDLNFLVKNSEELVLEGVFAKELLCDLVQEGSQRLKYLKIDSINTLQYLGDAMDCTEAPLILPTVESLHLLHLNNLQQISCSQLTEGSFGKLKTLFVYDCVKLRSIFQPSIATVFMQLTNLCVSRCKIMEEVIWKEREEDATSKIEFPKLEKLEIHYLPSLISFCRGIDEIEFPRLESLELDGLLQLKCLITRSSNQPSSSEEDHSFHSIFPHKVLFPRLVDMFLIDLHNMKEIWYGQVQSGSFYNLNLLVVKRCHSLRNLFSNSMAKYLVHLQSLRIDECWELEEVVSEGEDRWGNAEILPKLKTVMLENLPELASFCHVLHDLEFPMLEELYVMDCPKLKTFCPGFVHTPNLNNVKFSSKRFTNAETLWMGNLNSTLLHLHEQHAYNWRTFGI